MRVRSLRCGKQETTKRMNSTNEMRGLSCRRSAAAAAPAAAPAAPAATAAPAAATAAPAAARAAAAAAAAAIAAAAEVYSRALLTNCTPIRDTGI